MMTKKTAETKSSSIFPLLLGTTLLAGLCFLFVGLSLYGKVILGMIGIVFLLGAANKLKRGDALMVNLLLAGLACGSMILLSMDMYDQALIARTLSLIIFAFAGISAFGVFLKVVFGLVGLGLMVFLIGYASKNIGNDGRLSEGDVIEEPIGGDDNEQPKPHEAEPHDENDKLLSHQQQWQDYNFSSYKGKLEIWESNYEDSHDYKNTKLKPKNSRNPREYWGSIYAQLVRHDTEYMERILDTFIQIGRSKKLNELEFAQVIVSCVQSIPYVLVYRKDCSELAKTNPALAELARQHSCKGNVPYGLQSPAEFMQDLQGDCDTRTVFLFTILDKLGYKVAILNSDTYGHSMLGVGLPATGKYLDYRGQHYYFWETTAKGWNIGTLPPEMGQTKHWYVVLAN